MTVKEKSAIVVPTLMRPAFVDRFLHYLQDEKFQGGVILVDGHPDGTKDVQKNPTAGVVAAWEARSKTFRLFHGDTSHTWDPETQRSNFGMQLCVGGIVAEQAGYPYVIHSGDDDFIVPGALEDAAAYMDRFPGTRLVLGKRVRFSLDRPGAYGHVCRLGDVPYPSGLSSPDKETRLRAYFKAPYTLQFGLMRLELWQRAHEWLATRRTWYIGNEMGTNIYLALFGGPVHFLDGLMVAFQTHADKRFNWGVTATALKDVFLDRDCPETLNAILNGINLYEPDLVPLAHELISQHLAALLNNSCRLVKPKDPTREPGPMNLPERLRGGALERILALVQEVESP